MGPTVHFYQSSCDTPKTAIGAPRELVNRINHGDLYTFKTPFSFMAHGKCNFIYTYKKSNEFPCVDFYETHESRKALSVETLRWICAQYQILYCPTNALNYINCRFIKNTLNI